jgi:ribosomal protein L2
MRSFSIDSIAFIGRTLEEYTRMMALEKAGLATWAGIRC